MTLLETRDLSLRAGSALLVENASFRAEAGSLTMVIGPNGAGKTSLLRAALGLVRTEAGAALIEGRNVREMTPLERACRVAYLPQQRPLAWPQPVRDIVALGRFAYGAVPGRLGDIDRAAIERAIAACGLSELADRSADSLSGGEMSRVHLARALAAETPLLVADEPVTALDPRYQHETLSIFAGAARKGRGVLTVVHDLALAARYADRLIWMKEGRIVADGTPRETMTPTALRDVFGIEARLRLMEGRLVIEIEGSI